MNWLVFFGLISLGLFVGGAFWTIFRAWDGKRPNISVVTCIVGFIGLAVVGVLAFGSV